MSTQMKRKSNEEPRPARSLSELLALYDSDFVRGAYKTILGRDADMVGFAHFLQQLRCGSAKIDILDGLRRSPEGRRVGYDMPWLDRAIARRRRQKNPVYGWFFRLVYSGERDDANTIRLRVIENDLRRLCDLNDGRLERIELAIDRLQFMTGRQSDALAEFVLKQVGTSGVKTAAATEMLREVKISTPRRAPKELSPRASRFMRILRSARASAPSNQEA